MDNKVDIQLSMKAKKEYLNALIGKMHKILHLFEEQADTGFSPQHFIAGQLFEINAANSLFDGKLVPIIIKVKGIYDGREKLTYNEIKKQVFEIDKIIKSILKDVK